MPCDLRFGYRTRAESRLRALRRGPVHQVRSQLLHRAFHQACGTSRRSVRRPDHASRATACRACCCRTPPAGDGSTLDDTSDTRRRDVPGRQRTYVQHGSSCTDPRCHPETVGQSHDRAYTSRVESQATGPGTWRCAPCPATHLRVETRRIPGTGIRDIQRIAPRIRVLGHRRSRRDPHRDSLRSQSDIWHVRWFSRRRRGRGQGSHDTQDMRRCSAAPWADALLIRQRELGHRRGAIRDRSLIARETGALESKPGNGNESVCECPSSPPPRRRRLQPPCGAAGVGREFGTIPPQSRDSG